MINLAAIARYLDELFEVAHMPDDAPASIVRASDRPVTRLGLVLEPWPGIGHWAKTHAIDALFIHRPRRLDMALLDTDIGVIAYHRAFDEHLTIAHNPWLADAIGMTALEVLGTKEGRPIGMIGTVSADVMAHWPEYLAAIFGGLDEVHGATKATENTHRRCGCDEQRTRARSGLAGRERLCNRTMACSRCHRSCGNGYRRCGRRASPLRAVGLNHARSSAPGPLA